MAETTTPPQAGYVTQAPEGWYDMTGAQKTDWLAGQDANYVQQNQSLMDSAAWNSAASTSDARTGTIDKYQAALAAPSYAQDLQQASATGTQYIGDARQGLNEVYNNLRASGYNDGQANAYLQQKYGTALSASGITPGDFRAGWDSQQMTDQATREQMAQRRSGLISSRMTPGGAPAGSDGLSAGPVNPWNVGREQTVEGRIQSIINAGNPIIQSARTNAMEQMNDRGLINSSMAIGASDKAAYEAAIPIATADAATFAKAAGYNADEANQFSLQNAGFANQRYLGNLQSQTSLQEAKISADTSKYVSDKNAATALQQAQISASTQMGTAQLNAKTQTDIAQLDANNRVVVQNLQNQFQQTINTSSQAAAAFNQYVVASANIQNNPNLDAAAKNAALQQLWSTTYSQLAVLGKLNGLDLTSILTTTAATPAPAPATGIVNNAIQPSP